ncbi:phosphoserine phosphatase SerB [Mobilicoccus pelagius]|uniref:phosphoserine phosphatase n=1 Tax=Mobilicoccus pelagius NBRC 104925 TaxID=1089455 RepID=H5UTJ6_9MICO|nr:phosphoserine phosphatase SerB [Mobilicoccus pelagius]GAB49054.1 3-phosphoserine phosphatase [Mobilicoccus pelagius NBRC 104925]
MSVGTIPGAGSGLVPGGRLLVVMDVDSTFILEEVIELVATLAGTEDEVRVVTEAAMRGELDFAASLRARCATLAGLDAQVLTQVAESVTVTPGADVLVSALQEGGHAVALVSGGFVEIVEPLAARFGIGLVRANRFAVADGRLTGEVEGEIVDRAGKARALREFAAAEGIDLDHTVAIGDGANDLDMMGTAALGVAFCAKAVAREQADVAIDVPDLSLVLPLLGLDHGPAPA